MLIHASWLLLGWVVGMWTDQGANVIEARDGAVKPRKMRRRLYRIHGVG